MGIIVVKKEPSDPFLRDFGRALFANRPAFLDNPIILPGKSILCSKCGRGGGTLIKIEKDKYKHKDC